VPKKFQHKIDSLHSLSILTRRHFTSIVSHNLSSISASTSNKKKRNTIEIHLEIILRESSRNCSFLFFSDKIRNKQQIYLFKKINDRSMSHFFFGFHIEEKGERKKTTSRYCFSIAPSPNKKRAIRIHAM